MAARRYREKPVNLYEEQAQNELLRRAARVHYYSGDDGIESIAGTIDDYIRRALTENRRSGAVRKAWYELLPAELAEKCAILSVSRGILTVQVPPGPYMFEMKNASARLLAEMKKACPAARIKGIKLVARERKTDNSDY